MSRPPYFMMAAQIVSGSVALGAGIALAAVVGWERAAFELAAAALQFALFVSTLLHSGREMRRATAQVFD